MGTETDRESRVTLICPNLTCRRTLSAPASARGKVMRCAFCNVVFRVPQSAQLEAEPGEGNDGSAKK